MISDFVFWFFLAGAVVASFQDLKRQEIDNWLCLFLILGSFAFVFARGIFYGEIALVFISIFMLLIMILFSQILYNARFFAGGDTMLLLSMAVFFVSYSFYVSLVNLAVFFILLMFSGAVYGLGWTFVLFFKNFSEVSKVFKKRFNWYYGATSLIGLGLFLIGLYYPVVLGVGILVALFPVFYIFSKSLESVSFVKKVSADKLVPGDWLVKDVKVGGKFLRANWDGLSEDEIRLLKKKKKRVLIKGGIPFAPAFVLAIVAYYFFRSWIVGFLSFIF